MYSSNIHIISQKEGEQHKEDDLTDIFAKPAESRNESSYQSGHTVWGQSQPFVDTTKPVHTGQTAALTVPTWKLSLEDSYKSGSQGTILEGSTENFLTSTQSVSTEKETVESQETTVPAQFASEFSYDSALERRRRLEAVIGAAKERAAKSFGSPSATAGESLVRQPAALVKNVEERSQRPKLTARAIRERLAASKYASFRTRSTAGSSVSSTTSLPFSRYNEELSQNLSRSPVTSRRKPVLDARLLTGSESHDANFHERFTSTSSVDDKIRSADELLSRLEMNTSSNFSRLVSHREHDKEEKPVAEKPLEMKSSQESILSSSVLPTNESSRRNMYTEAKQEAEIAFVDNSISPPGEREQSTFQFLDSGRMNTSDDLSSIFETKNPLEFQFSPFDVSAQAEFGSDINGKQMEQSLLNNQSSFEFPRSTTFSDSLEYSTKGQGHSSFPVDNWRNDEVFNSSNENLPLVTTSSSNMEDLSCIFEDKGPNDFPSCFLKEPPSSQFQSEAAKVEFEPVLFGISQGQVTVENSTYPTGNSSVGTLSYKPEKDPVFMKEEMEEIHLGGAEVAEDAVEQSHFRASLNNHSASLPSVSTDTRYTQASLDLSESSVPHLRSSLIFPEKHAIVCFGPQGYLLTSFPQIIPGFRVWNGREYVEDSSSTVVKPGAINIVSFIEMVEDTEEGFFECIRNLHEDSIYNLGTEPIKVFCEKIASSCRRHSESLLWNILKVLSSYSSETDYDSFRVELKSILCTKQQEGEFASTSTQFAKTGHVNDCNNRSLETLLSKSSKLEDVLQTAVVTENWAIALLLSKLVGSSLTENVTRQFVYSQLQEFPLIRFLVLLSNEVIPNLREMESVNWMTAARILFDCEASYRRKGLIAFGDYLSMHQSNIFASHCCYILAGTPIYSESFFSSRLTWEEKDPRMLLIGADPRSAVRASLTSIPSIMRTIFYVYLRENRLSIELSPFLLHLSYVLVETGRLVLAKHLCGFLVNKAHTLLKSNDPHFVSEAQRLTAVYYSYLEQLDDRLHRMVSDDSNEKGEHGVSLTRSLSKVFRSIAKTGSKKNLRPRSSSNSSWESFAAAAVSIIAPAEENDATCSMKHTRNSNMIPSSETTSTENIPSAISSPVRASESVAQGHQSNVSSTKQNSELMIERISPAGTPNKDTAHSKLATNQLPSKTDSRDDNFDLDRRAAEDRTKHTPNDSHDGAYSGSHEKKHSSRRSLSSFLMEKLTKIAGPKQANLGKENKFYYDEKLGRWVCEGGEENNEEAPPPPPSKLLDSSNASQFTYVKEPEEIQDDMHRAMSRRRWSARARYVDTFGQADQISGTKPPLVVPPSAATRQILKHSDASDISQLGVSMFTPAPIHGNSSDVGNADWNASTYSESSGNNVSDAFGTNN
ncbi:hypothetical protein GpartN1_g5854.t1 [Galdieria partita]|uniref:Sec16 Sec23-binding domain-containing protein n=1 Tax=Galdieria partita TaxID=83374 RepID=A0A9C7USQ1_9RHOD|nr:hypothetical protein GpartN1_g5854.t1 [Galdieria partita]